VTWLLPLGTSCVKGSASLAVAASAPGKIRTIRFFDGKRLIKTVRKGTIGLYTTSWRTGAAKRGPHKLRVVVQSRGRVGAGAAQRPRLSLAGVAPRKAMLRSSPAARAGSAPRSPDTRRPRLAAGAAGRGGERLAEVASEVGSRTRGLRRRPIAPMSNGGAAVREAASGDPPARQQRRHSGPGGFLDLEPEQIEHLVRTNYLGSVWCLRAFLPALEAGAPADSSTSLRSRDDRGRALRAYSASKHAQLAFSRSVGVELARQRDHGSHGHSRASSTRPDSRTGPVSAAACAAGGRRPELVAEQVVRGIERNRLEQFVPRWYRPAAIVQAAAPGCSPAPPLVGERRNAK
jgi:NAD(P)-dependent dehydrogenase (short-subunit alcohol dehydrogenase family)